MNQIKRIKLLNKIAINIFPIGVVLTILLGVFQFSFYIIIPLWFFTIMSTLIIRNSLKCPFCKQSILKKKKKVFGMEDWHLHVPSKCPNCNKELK